MIGPCVVFLPFFAFACVWSRVEKEEKGEDGEGEGKDESSGQQISTLS